MQAVNTYPTILVMLSRLLPTDVPPYFWTTQGRVWSSELRTRSSRYGAVGVDAEDMAWET